METLSDTVEVDAFFDRVAGAERPVLLLDYDGTLAPFRENRDAAVPYPGVRERLERIIETNTTRLVLISGRPVADVQRLAGLDHTVEIWGTHGWEQLMSDGTYRGPELSADLIEILDEAAGVISEDLKVPERCERKPASVAFHVRDVPEEQADRELAQVRGAWRDLIDGQPLSIEPFDGGIELRIDGRDKGEAVRSILEEGPEDQPVAYLGDDLTDEDAFEALQGRGLRVLVREEKRDTRADLWIVPPGELLDFLDRWQRTVSP